MPLKEDLTVMGTAKITLLLLTAFLAVSPVRSATMPTFTIRISTKDNVVSVGSDIRINIAVTNVSQNAIRLPDDKSHKAELSGYQIEVERASKRPHMKKYYWRLTGKKAPRDTVSNINDTFIIASNPGSVPLPPKKTIHYYTIINELYDLSWPGEYTIQVEKVDPATGDLVKSNVISVTLKKL